MELAGLGPGITSWTGGRAGSRGAGTTPELSLDVPDGMPLMTATVPSGAESVVTANAEIDPEVGVVILPCAFSGTGYRLVALGRAIRLITCARLSTGYRLVALGRAIRLITCWGDPPPCGPPQKGGGLWYHLDAGLLAPGMVCCLGHESRESELPGNAWCSIRYRAGLRCWGYMPNHK